MYGGFSPVFSGSFLTIYKLEDMALITSIRTKVREDNSVLAIIRTEGMANDAAPIFLTSKQIAAACGLSTNFSLLKGADLNVTFYKKGDKLVSGAEVTDEGKIVKEFDLELPAKLQGIQAAAAFGASMF